MKIVRSSIVFALAGLSQATRACEVCAKEQPAVLQGISHGTGPQGNFDYIIIWSAAILVGFTLVMSIKHLLRPERNCPDHIKHFILEKEDPSHAY